MINTPSIPFLPRRRKPVTFGAPVALTLVSAEYAGNDEPYTITLTFDRAINIASFDGSQVIVKDGETNGRRYTATGAANLVGPNAVQAELAEVGNYDPQDVLLTASAASGIVASDDAATWAGVTDLGLPFP